MWQPIHIKSLVNAASGEKKNPGGINSFASFVSSLNRHGKLLIVLAFIMLGAILTAAAGHELVCDLSMKNDYTLCVATGSSSNNNPQHYYTPIPPPTHLIEMGSRAIYTQDGAVNIFDFDRPKAAWIPRGQPIKEPVKDYAGWSLSLSRDGNSLSIASLDYGRNNRKLSTRSVFEYHPASNSWVKKSRWSRSLSLADLDGDIVKEAQFIMKIAEHGNESEGMSVTRFS